MCDVCVFIFLLYHIFDVSKTQRLAIIKIKRNVQMTVLPFGLPLIWDHSFSNIAESSYLKFSQKDFLGELSIWSDSLVNLFLLPHSPLNHISPDNTNVMSAFIMKEGTKGKQRTRVLCILLLYWCWLLFEFWDWLA